MSFDLDIYVERLTSFRSIDSYALTYLLPLLAKAGVTYRLLDHVPLDAPAACAFLHVDLTDVPEPFASVHRLYAKTINGRANTIRRTLYSDAIVQRGDTFEGPAISKTILNSHGYPELRYRKNRSLGTRVAHVWNKLTRPGYKDKICPPYQVHDSIDDVPDEVWADPRLIVERFLPGNLTLPVEKYRYQFALSEELNVRSSYDDLLCDPRKVISTDVVEEVPVRLRDLRDRLHLDYGAIDYFIVDGEVAIIDANKTVQTVRNWKQFEFVGDHRNRAFAAIMAYLES